MVNMAFHLTGTRLSRQFCARPDRCALPLAVLLTTLLAGALTCLAPAQALAATARSVCDDRDAGSAAVLLQPAAASFDARAYWLNRALISWPGQPGQDRYRLYFSASAQIRAQPGAVVNGAGGSLALEVDSQPLPTTLAERFRFVGKGVHLRLKPADQARLGALLTVQLVLVHEDGAGIVLDATALQSPGALDDLYAAAAQADDLGVQINQDSRFKLWAPTARQVGLCLYASGSGPAVNFVPMQFAPGTGIWSARSATNLSGGYYKYAVEVFVPGTGIVRQLVTDPYSISLTTDSRRSYIGDLDAAALKPAGWQRDDAPRRVRQQTDMSVYELHVRDFSINDASVPGALRGKFRAFTQTQSNGMRHLAALARAGMTDIHLLPAFDLANIPEHDCITPTVPQAAVDSDLQQAAVMQHAADDCYNWGYEPFHFNAPEGSYATDPADGARRIIEMRQMVMSLHAIGLRVGMDVVFNHTSAAGQDSRSVLDRIVPGYYHRLNAAGVIENSTCCANTATEHRMMGKLMTDSVALWARAYHIDSFRFDLMAHQPRSVMLDLQAKVNRARGRTVNLIGEGWNFGEVADGARFVQASQLSLNGSGIATFSDRARDAVRGGGPADNAAQLQSAHGWINGLGASADLRQDLLAAADMVRVGLAGSLRNYRMQDNRGGDVTLAQIDYHGQPAGYVSQPGEVVNYVENHDNLTLYDLQAWKLPRELPGSERARIQMLGAAITAFSQGVAYFHAGFDILRSKSMDRDSFNSGDWFNRLDWTYQDNYFGSGLPPKAVNGEHYAQIGPLLADVRIKPLPQDIADARDMFRDLLRIRASTALFHLTSAREVQQRLHFDNLGPTQNPQMIVGQLDGVGYPGAHFAALLYFINAADTTQEIVLPQARRDWVLHPVQRAPTAADPRAAQARYAGDGRFSIPPRSAVVFVAQ
jgi:pullulanase/glycogen debranching enzyme